MQQQIIKCDSLSVELSKVLQTIPHDKLFVLTDEHTHKHCLPTLQETGMLDNVVELQIPAGEINKNLDSLATVWAKLSQHGATRNSLLINLGGGMVTDLGGFAAATFKRGIRFINIPTTLLAAVDAAVGGKTGIDFQGLKNEIGAFAPAEAVLIDTKFLKTLDFENFMSGYAEMLKHSLINSEKDWLETLNFDLDKIDYRELSRLLMISVGIKEKIVTEDPNEKGIRKALNFGHTIGHAMESYCIETGSPVLHGSAVAWGMACELYLSFQKLNFDRKKLIQTAQFIKENYKAFVFDCNQYERLYELMLHDKKNEDANSINFTLLQDIGDVRINQTATKEEILESFDFYREFFC